MQAEEATLVSGDLFLGEEKNFLLQNLQSLTQSTGGKIAGRSQVQPGKGKGAYHKG